MDGLELHGSELRQIANAMITESGKMRTNLENATQKVQSLVNSYQGQAASAFMDNYNSRLKPQFEDICQKIVTVANFIISSVDSYEAQDKASAEAASNIQAN